MGARISFSRSVTLSELNWAEFDCAMVESPSAVEFLDLHDETSRLNAARYEKGTAFSAASELRWQGGPGAAHAVYVNDNGVDLAGAEGGEDLEPASGPTEILLWGFQEDDGSFYEDRIPRALNYPAWAPTPAAHERLTVRIKHYIRRAPLPPLGDDEVEWIPSPVRLFRCCGFGTTSGAEAPE